MSKEMGDKGMDDLDDALDAFDDDIDDELRWSWNYVSICILMAAFNGFLNGYPWSGFSLHYTQMGWPLGRSGVSTLCGFILRLLFQQIQMPGFANFWWVRYFSKPKGRLDLTCKFFFGMIFNDFYILGFWQIQGCVVAFGLSSP